MPILRYLCEGTQGAAVATTSFTPNAVQVNNSGASSAWSFDAAMAAQGTTGLKIVTGTTAANSIRLNLESSSLTQAMSFEVTLPSRPATGSIPLHAIRTASGVVMRMQYNTDGRVFLEEAAGAAWIGDIAPTAGTTAGSKYRVSYWLTANATTTGSIRAVMYPTGGLTPLATEVAKTGRNFGTAVMTQADFGITSTPSANYTIGIDSIQSMGGVQRHLPPVASTSTSPLAVTRVEGGTKVGAAATVVAGLGDSDDTTGVQTSGTAGDVVGLVFDDTLKTGAASFTFRAKLASAGTATVSARLYAADGTTAVAAAQTFTVSSTTASDFTYSLTQAESDALTDRAGLILKTTQTA